MKKAVIGSFAFLLPVFAVIMLIRVFRGAPFDEVLPTNQWVYFQIFRSMEFSQNVLYFQRTLIDMMLDWVRWDKMDWVNNFWSTMADAVKNVAFLTIFGLPFIFLIVICYLIIPITYVGWLIGIVLGIFDIPDYVNSSATAIFAFAPLAPPLGV